MKFQAIDPADMLKRKQQEESGYRPSSQLAYCHEMFQPGMYESHHNLLETMTQRSSENELDNMIREEEFESKSGTDIMEPPSDDQDPNQRPKKKRYHRHTPHQIQEMESFYKECPHPDDKQRKELGRRLSLEPLQVKFWFQNKRTQMKSQNERHENSQLRNENEKLRVENIRYKEALTNATCPNCGGPASIGEMSFDEQHLRIENARLKEEIDRISGIAAKYVGKPMITYNPNLSTMPSHALDLGVGGYGPPPGFVGDMYSAGGLLRSVSGPTEADKPMIVELAVAAMEELIRMAHLGEPLWIPNIDNSSLILSEDEYVRAFPRGIGPKPLGLRSEASRESAEVMMNPINLIEILMNVNQWTCMFASIVSRAMTLDVLSTGAAGNYDGGLQVMTAEFQIPTLLVPTRENYFLRYCKHCPDGTWAVVDVSLDNLRPNTISRCRRRPSGCVIQDLHDGRSKVIWVEHVEVDDRAVDNMYRGLVTSGLAFGAKRWVTTLDRQCQRLATAMANDIPMGGAGVITTAEGIKSMLKLAERMVMSFCGGVGASTAHTWTTVSGSGVDDVRVMPRKSVDDPGRPPGTVLCAATSFWIPVSPKRVFDFLRDEKSRSKWDILSTGCKVHKIEHIANGYDQGNAVTLLRVNSDNACQSNMLILQESSTDATGSYIVYAPVDIGAMDVVISGGDPDYVALLPSGFAILPDGSGHHHDGGTLEPEVVVSGGSLLTVAFQILVEPIPTAKLTLNAVATINSLITNTIGKIKDALASDNA